MKIIRAINHVEYYELEGIVATDTSTFRRWLEENPDFSVAAWDFYDDDEHRTCFRVMTTTREIDDA